MDNALDVGTGVGTSDQILRTHVNARRGWWLPCNSSTQKAERGDPWSYLARLPWINELWVQLRYPVSMNKVETTFGIPWAFNRKVVGVLERE